MEENEDFNIEINTSFLSSSFKIFNLSTNENGILQTRFTFRSLPRCVDLLIQLYRLAFSNLDKAFSFSVLCLLMHCIWERRGRLLSFSKCREEQLNTEKSTEKNSVLLFEYVYRLIPECFHDCSFKQSILILLCCRYFMSFTYRSACEKNSPRNSPQCSFT